MCACTHTPPSIPLTLNRITEICSLMKSDFIHSVSCQSQFLSHLHSHTLCRQNVDGSLLTLFLNSNKTFLVYY